jgi:hypothetical protein
MNINTARKILGNTVNNLNDNQVQNIISKLQYIAESFLDLHEKEIFQGKTLKQLLQNEQEHI